MKTLLITIALFLTANVSGQLGYEIITDHKQVTFGKYEILKENMEAEPDTALMDIGDYTYSGPYSYIEFRSQAYIDAKIDKRIVELWREYEATLRIGGEYIYYYKEPTFPGFMEFIERKTTEK